MLLNDVSHEIVTESVCYFYIETYEFISCCTSKCSLEELTHRVPEVSVYFSKTATNNGQEYSTLTYCKAAPS